MDFTDLDPKHQAYMLDFIKSHYGHCDQQFDGRIADADEMFHKAIVPGYANLGSAYLAYIQSGRRMLDVVEQLAEFAFGGLRNVDSFLEFACGYGRFTRHLVMKYPHSRVVASDIYRGAVDWQHKQFGVCGIYSTPDPVDYSLVSSFDIIFVGSLFSHLPETLFEKWLERLYKMLSPNGVIAFSVHDRHLVPPKKQQKDFHYERQSESDSLSLSIYGMTYVSEEYVGKVIRKVCHQSDGRYRCFTKGLYENQDLYVVSRNANLDWSDFDLVITPIGGKVFSQVHGTNVLGSAWALDLNQDNNLNAEVYVNNVMNKLVPTEFDSAKLIEKHFPCTKNPPVNCSIEVPQSAIPSGAILKCRVSATDKYYHDIYLDCFNENIIASSGDGQTSSKPNFNGMWGINGESQDVNARGFYVELQEDTLVLIYYGYLPDGSCHWYIAMGQFNSQAFTSNLLQYRNGTALGGNYATAVDDGSVGMVSVLFDKHNTGTISLPGEEPKNISKLSFHGKNLPSLLPINGIWVIDAENNGNNGRGFIIEHNEGALIFTYFGYTTGGNAVWFNASGNMSGNSFAGDLIEYANGPVMGQTFTPAFSAGSPGQVTITFTSPLNGTIQLPGETTKAMRKFYW